MKFEKYLLAAGMAGAIALSAYQASAADGFYVGVQSGLPVPQRTDGTINGAATRRIETSYKFGFGVGAAVGYAFPPSHKFGGLRLELEYEYFFADPDKQHIKGGANFGLVGHIDQHSIFVNTYYDFHWWEHILPVTPYLGVGFGGSLIKMDHIKDGIGPSKHFNDTDTVFAFQFIAGAAYEISKNLLLGAEYRYIHHDNPKFTDFVTGAGRLVVKSESRRHMFGLSLRYYMNLM